MKAPGKVLLAVASALAVAFAGCVQSPGANVAEASSSAGVPWEAELATWVETPELAPRRSAADREAKTSPPGDPRYAAFDAVMLRFMEAYDVPAASVAALNDGKLRYVQGYGHLDEGRTAPTPPDAMFRIASITKPMTAAVITMLVEEDRMSWEDPVFCLPPEPAAGCLLDIEPHPKRPVQDPRLADLTLRHLVVHQTGWTRGPCTDPLVSEVMIGIAGEFGVESPPPTWRLAQWFMGTPMQFDPGTVPDGLDRYCNMGYALLGLIAEAETGATMPALYDAYVFRPLEIAGDIEPGRSRPEDRNPREPFYACDYGDFRDAYDPARYGCASETLLPLEPALAVGGLIATADAVGAVFEVFDNDGSVRDPEALKVYRNGHTGGLPGTATTARRLSVGGEAGADLSVVVLMNTQAGHELVPLSNYHFQGLYAELLAAFAAVESTTP